MSEVSRRVAVVTGSNKGIGYAIVKALCHQMPEWTVYLTARDEGRGNTAVEELKSLGYSPRFCQLDISSQESIEKAKTYFIETHGGIDVLINNAGIAFKVNSTVPFPEQAEATIRNNFFGTVNVSNSFYPIFRPHGRLVFVAAKNALSALEKCSDDLKSKFKNPDLTLTELSSLMNKFVSDTKSGLHKEEGWPATAYGVAKIGETALSRIFQQNFDNDERHDLVANACCPGFVQTDMSSHKGPLTPEQGAENPVYLALLPNDTDIRGRFVVDKKVVPW